LDPRRSVFRAPAVKTAPAASNRGKATGRSRAPLAMMIALASIVRGPLVSSLNVGDRLSHTPDNSGLEWISRACPRSSPMKRLSRLVFVAGIVRVGDEKTRVRAPVDLAPGQHLRRGRDRLHAGTACLHCRPTARPDAPTITSPSVRSTSWPLTENCRANRALTGSNRVAGGKIFRSKTRPQNRSPW